MILYKISDFYYTNDDIADIDIFVNFLNNNYDTIDFNDNKEYYKIDGKIIKYTEIFISDILQKLNIQISPRSIYRFGEVLKYNVDHMFDDHKNNLVKK